MDKFEVPPELQYTIVNMEETILDQCVPPESLEEKRGRGRK